MGDRLKRQGFWVAVATLIGGGSALLVLSSEVSLPQALSDVVPAIGTALLVAGILAASVDRWLKQRLLRDAFQHLFGYLLPDELREELGWIFRQELLSPRHDLTVRLTPTDDPDLLTLRLEIQREIRNITSHPVSFQPIFALDEWFHPGRPSRIDTLRCIRAGSPHGEMEDLATDSFAIGKKLPHVTVDPNSTVTLVQEGEETRHSSDAFFLHVASSTVRARVNVEAPDHIGWSVMFGARERVHELGPHAVELAGTMLPGQMIQVRWWPKAGAPS